MNKSLVSKSVRLVRKGNTINCKHYSSTSQPASEEEKERELEKIAKDASIDEPPTACCQSGCSNCVFIVWAEALTSKIENSGPEIIEKIMKSVEDPSMKAYLELELKMRLKK